MIGASGFMQAPKANMNCPQCETETESLYEGYCRECCDENQNNLDVFNANYDHWKKATNQERDTLIKQAMQWSQHDKNS